MGDLLFISNYGEGDERQITMAKAEGVERCITGKIKNWAFPRPRGGGTVEVRYPFILTTTG